MNMKWIPVLYFILSILLFISCLNSRSKKESEKIDSSPEVIFIKGGKFIMGSNSGQGVDKRNIKHKIILYDFYLGKYEVTVKEFSLFVKETNYITDAEKKDSSLAFVNGKWGKHKGVNWRYDATGAIRLLKDYNHPVVHVSWNDANAYCQWLSKRSGKNYRLPTEVEWEFAARNRGKDIIYSWGNGNPTGKNGGNVADDALLKLAPDAKGWKGVNDEFPFTSPVGSFNPNELGLYDMTGNVWEWCNNWFDENYYGESTIKNPFEPSSGNVKSFRGGCWFSDEEYSIITFHKFGNYPDQSYGDFGFRIAIIPKLIY